MITASHIQNFSYRLDEIRVLVVGDLMLDRYMWGNVSRISPEAPVPVVDVAKEENRPGGAANVALNVVAMGAHVSLCGAVGADVDGEILLGLLDGQRFDTTLIQQIAGRKTTTKTRIIGNNQQMMRVDSEQKDHLPDQVYEKMLEEVEERLQQIDVVIFEDYDKGVLQADFIKKLNALARDRDIPTVVDPKFRQFFDYSGVSLFKPNLKELNEGLNLRAQKFNLEDVLEAVRQLRTRMPHANTLITLSENGVLAVDEQGLGTHIEAHYRKITDVSGAGDTVVALMALAMAADLPLPIASAISNLGGGLVCEEVGVVPIDRERLFAEMRRLAAL